MRVTQGVYRHYKNGQLYRLLFIAKDSTNNSPTADQDMAVYVGLYDDGRVSVRALAEFDEFLPAPDGSRVQRFSFVSE